MRGLKHQYNQLYKYGEDVASFTDAWIETDWLPSPGGIAKSHLLQMRGLKQGAAYAKTLAETSHLLQMRGLKLKFKRFFGVKAGRIFYRCVD